VVRPADHLGASVDPTREFPFDVLGVAELIAFAEDELLGPGIGRGRSEVLAEPQRRGDGEPAGMARVLHRQRHVGAERPPGDGQRKIIRDRRRKVTQRRLRVEPFADSTVVGTLAPLDAAEVEAEAGHAPAGQGLEQRAVDDRSHRSPVEGMGVADHQPGARVFGEGHLSLDAQTVLGREQHVTTMPAMPDVAPIATPITATAEQLAAVKYDDHGLVTCVMQEAGTGRILQVAYMNEEALRRTFETGRMWYWSRSRSEFWRKGDTSGDRQWLREAYYDCDGDALLFVIEQEGKGACHTGERTCFYRAFGA